MCITKKIIFIFLFVFSLLPCMAVKPIYTAIDGWVVGHNTGRYNNRPIYLNNSNGFIMAGDRPLLTFVKQDNVYGQLVLTYVHDGKEKRLCEFEDITSSYRAGQMSWVLKSQINPQLLLKVELVRRSAALGAEMRITAKGFVKGDLLKWENGGNKRYKNASLSWGFDPLGHPDILKNGVSKDFNAIQKKTSTLKGALYLSMTMDEKSGLLNVTDTQKKSFDEASFVNRQFQSRLMVDTPDAYLNAMSSASLAAVDGTWYPPVFVHGCMQWNNRLPGWRTMFGGTMYGWHDRVFDEAQFYIRSQVKTSNKMRAKADSALLLTSQHKDSRFFGVGRIQCDQQFYDMQSQFFDQLVEEYRWNNSPEFAALLRPALELHIQWMDECFDPDCDGLYESYINSWPTDSQWYNGGGTAEETAYAFRAHQAALDMALASGDTLSARRHQSVLTRIQKGFSNLLWLKNLGHAGSYREQGGYQRVHTDPWLYGIFLPIDAHLTSPLQRIESLYYPEYALQNDTVGEDGRVVWTSNWVPGIWSVRELWPGDNYHLAQSYFQSGMPDEGFQVMKGMFLRSGFYHLVPGDIGSDQGGCDFGDCVHPFARALVSGLFGFHPNYPKGEVEIAPSFPSSWTHASIRVPDYQLNFVEKNNIVSLNVVLRSSAHMRLQIPVRCNQVESVTLNDKSVAFECSPSVGRTWIVIKTNMLKKANVIIRYDRQMACSHSIDATYEVGSSQTLAVDGCQIVSISDPQKVFTHYEPKEGAVQAKVSFNTGRHTIIATVETPGKCLQWRVFHVNVVNHALEVIESRKNPEPSSLKNLSWQPVDITPWMNADVRTIFEQKYLSPRPNTVSVRIGSDGYSLWTFPFWRSKVPTIALDSVERYRNGPHLVTPQGVKFCWDNQNKNISFVSLWDNYPDEVNVALHRIHGDVISLLICGSTNVMQCRIANAVIYLNYADGQCDAINLVPPVNYWNLCPIVPNASANGQASRTYYTSKIDRFCMPQVMPQTVSLGRNCTAMLISRHLRKDVGVESVTLKCLSQEVVVGLMGISIGR